MQIQSAPVLPGKAWLPPKQGSGPARPPSRQGHRGSAPGGSCSGLSRLQQAFVFRCGVWIVRVVAARAPCSRPLTPWGLQLQGLELKTSLPGWWVQRARRPVPNPVLACATRALMMSQVHVARVEVRAWAWAWSPPPASLGAASLPPSPRRPACRGCTKPPRTPETIPQKGLTVPHSTLPKAKIPAHVHQAACTGQAPSLCSSELDAQLSLLLPQSHPHQGPKAPVPRRSPMHVPAHDHHGPKPGQEPVSLAAQARSRRLNSAGSAGWLARLCRSQHRASSPEAQEMTQRAAVLRIPPAAPGGVLHTVPLETSLPASASLVLQTGEPQHCLGPSLLPAASPRGVCSPAWPPLASLESSWAWGTMRVGGFPQLVFIPGCGLSRHGAENLLDK